MASHNLINCVLFGYGRAGKIHYNTLGKSTQFKLKYVVEIIDISSEIDKNVEYADFNDKSKIIQIMEDETIKAVFITTPTLTHFELASLSLTYGKHVFVEKPLVDNLDQINQCFELANSKNRILFVGYNRRFDKKLMDVKKKIRK